MKAADSHANKSKKEIAFVAAPPPPTTASLHLNSDFQMRLPCRTPHSSKTAQGRHYECTLSFFTPNGKSPNMPRDCSITSVPSSMVSTISARLQFVAYSDYSPYLIAWQSRPSPLWHIRGSCVGCSRLIRTSNNEPRKEWAESRSRGTEND
ncbi:uncharacterized [Tachysurus ichikawai]